jgi:hypothetical protein
MVSMIDMHYVTIPMLVRLMLDQVYEYMLIWVNLYFDVADVVASPMTLDGRWKITYAPPTHATKMAAPQA